MEIRYTKQFEKGKLALANYQDSDWIQREQLYRVKSVGAKFVTLEEIWPNPNAYAQTIRKQITTYGNSAAVWIAPAFVVPCEEVAA